MENNIRFRNHFSMVLPNLKGLLWIVVMAFMSVFLRDEGEGFEDVIITVLIWILIAIAILVWQIIIWAKTWITVSEQSVVIECNTFFSRRKNTIGIANISNINLEQSLTAMLFGTCKLKLDTNSLSTAETTDVTIVLKKREAENLQALLMRYVSGLEASEVPKPEDVHSVSAKDILLHGVFSSRFLYTIFIPLFILLEFATEMDEADFDIMVEEVGNFAAETVGLGLFILIALVVWGVLAAVFSLVKNAVKYWDFQIERREQKLVLEYGLTKKVNYSIPIDKIQAVVLKQTLFARLCKRYMVEVVNVGMNDDEQEAQAFLLPYESKPVLKERIRQLLPEFSDYLELEAERQPKSIWVVWLWPVFVYLLIVGVILGAVAEFVPEFLGIASGILGIISIAILAVKAAGYQTEGIKFDGQVLLVVNGSFSRKCTYIKYDKIQHICLHQSFLAKRFAIHRGDIHLLASAKNQVQELPYFREEKIEEVKMHLVKSS